MTELPSSLNWENGARALFVFVFLSLLGWLQARSRRTRRAANLQIHAAKKFKRRNEARAKLLKDLQDPDSVYGAVPDKARQDFLLNLSATDLHRRMHVEGDVRCVEVVLLYVLRSLAADALLNCLTEDFGAEALEEAAKVDARIAARRAGEDDSVPKSMEGVPVSIKDAFDQRGADSTCGIACRALKPMKDDGLLVRMLRAAGAIPFTRTNVPQGLMVPESMNIVYGRSNNPYNLSRTPGGSSGGEGALLAARGSVLGLGSDIGGSLRIPSHFCGLYTLKPTPARITLDGLAIPCVNDMSGQLAIRPVAGPMAHCVDDVVLMLRVFLDAQKSTMWEEDVTVPRVPLDEDIIYGKSERGPGKKLRIGYFEHDGFFAAAPSCARAVRQAVVALQECGHELVRWSPPGVAHGVKAFYAIMSADSAAEVVDALEGEEVADEYKDLLLLLKVPGVVRRAVVAVLRQVGQLRAALLLQSVAAVSGQELYTVVHTAFVSFQARFTAAWQSEGFDAVICPGMGVPALRHGESKDLTPSCSYTLLWNVLHYPVGSVPVGLVDKSETGYEEATGTPKDLFTSKTAASVAGSEGLPVGVQVAALPWRDEIVLRVMRDLERRIRFDERPQLAKQLQI